MPRRILSYKRNRRSSRKTNPRKSRRTILSKHRTKRSGGSAVAPPPTVQAPSCGIATPAVVPQCMTPVDVSSYKNPCASGVLPLDGAFLNGGVAVGGRRVRKTVNKKRGGVKWIQLLIIANELITKLKKKDMDKAKVLYKRFHSLNGSTSEFMPNFIYMFNKIINYNRQASDGESTASIMNKLNANADLKTKFLNQCKKIKEKAKMQKEMNEMIETIQNNLNQAEQDRIETIQNNLNQAEQDKQGSSS